MRVASDPPLPVLQGQSDPFVGKQCTVIDTSDTYTTNDSLVEALGVFDDAAWVQGDSPSIGDVGVVRDRIIWDGLGGHGWAWWRRTCRQRAVCIR